MDTILKFFDSISPNQISWSIFTCILLEYFFELFLSLRQRRVYSTVKEIPAPLKQMIDKETFEKARNYGTDKNAFGIFSEFYSIAVLALLLKFDGLYIGWKVSNLMLENAGIWPEGWDQEIGQSIAFGILAVVFNNIIGLPLSLYSTFVLEEKHGFNKQTLGFFVKDHIKAILVSITIMSPFIGLIVKIVQVGGTYFFIWMWAFCFVVLLFLMTIYPMFIAPLFDKYTTLKDGPLRTRIETLAARIKFPLTKLYVVEGSKRSAHSNAYLYGFFNNKRIVLFDTLIKGYVVESEESEEKKEEELKSEEKKKEEAEKGCTDEEIEAVLGHELGHWKLNHVMKNIFISELNIFFVFAIFSLFHGNWKVYRAFGFPEGSVEPIFIGLIIVLQFILQVYNTAMSFCMNILSRKFEFEADEFATGLGYGNELKKALSKLNKDNLSFPVSDHLFSAWHHSHPTLLQRLEAIDDFGKKDE